MSEIVNVVNATAIPVQSATPVQKISAEEEALKKVVVDTASAINDVIESFSDEVPVEEAKEAKKASSFLNDFMGYIKGNDFKNDINDTAKKYGVPPKKLAQNFFERALGTIGDVLGIAIHTVSNAGHMLIDILTTVMHGGINLITKVAGALANIVTLNKTCVVA